MYDVIIIGSGPTGGSASLFLGKAKKKVLLIDNDNSPIKRAWVENYYGVDEITGPNLLKIGDSQIKKYGVEKINDTVTNIEKQSDHFKLISENNEYKTKHIIFATGMSTDLADKVGLDIMDGTEPRIKKIIKINYQGKTSIDGIWAAGTVAGMSMHNIVVAGHGAHVAINIISELNDSRYVDHDVIK